MTHPIIEATGTIAAALTAVADSNPTFMSTDDKAAALRELSRAEARLAELRLRVLADAGDLAATTGAHDIAEWLTVHLHARHEEARAELRLAHALDRRYAATARGLRDGEVGVAQAQVIVASLDRLPAEVPADLLAVAESTLLGHAADFGPRQLARLGRRILDIVAPEIADAVEARRLAALETDAQRRTRLCLRRVGDGTTRLSGLLPDAAATRLATYLDAFTNPRRDPGDHAHDTVGTADPLARLPYPRRLGQAFCQLLEAVDPMRLPLHGGDATTIVVTIPFASLVAELGTADLAGGQLPGDHLPGTTLTREPGPAPRVHRTDPPRRARRPVGAPRPRSQPTALLPCATRGPATARWRLPCRGLHDPRRLVRGPSLGAVAGRRTHRSRQRPPAVPSPPSTGARHRLPTRTPGQRRRQVPPTQIGPGLSARCRAGATIPGR